jgi:hypothetical protein
MRGRQGHDRTGDAEDLAVLCRDVPGVDVSHLHPGGIAVAATARAAVKRIPVGLRPACGLRGKE